MEWSMFWDRCNDVGYDLYGVVYCGGCKADIGQAIGMGTRLTALEQPTYF